VFHLHSCGLGVLERGDLAEELSRAREAGKIRVVAYSGENDALAWAIRSGQFGAVQCSVNPFDQRALVHEVPVAAARGLAVIGKRAMGNAPWRFSERPRGSYAETYYDRLQRMEIDPRRLPPDLLWPELALRFSAFAPGVTSALVGSKSVAHLQACASLVGRGPLDPEIVAHLVDAFRTSDDGWVGQV
jgi:aryl-alcohol dehydrogenase-like predicted oxidoreductase